MSIVTAVEVQQKDQSRVNVYLDGEFGFGLAAILAVGRGLKPGVELSDEEVARFRRDDLAERAYAAGLNFLSYRPRSRQEVALYYRRKGVELEVAEMALERLARIGLLNDDEFARFWVENRQNFRPRGSRALRQEMRQKGLAGEVIEEALSGLPEEEESAYRAGERKAVSLRTLGEQEFYRKLVAFLQRRGFPYEAAAAATRRLWQDLAAQ